MKNRKLNKFIISALMLLAAVSCFGGYILNDYIKTPKKNTSDIDISEENIYKPSKSERDINSIISDVLVKGVNRESKLVTTEINLDCEIIIDESYLDWNILKKQQALKFYATALYAVDLGNFTKDDILLTESGEDTESIEDIGNAGKIKITVYIEEPKLLSFAVDSEKTVVGKVESGLLRFGDIKLTPEDFKKIQLRASINMTEQLHNEEINNLTKQNAKKAVTEFFKVVLENFDSGIYEIEVEFKQ